VSSGSPPTEPPTAASDPSPDGRVELRELILYCRDLGWLDVLVTPPPAEEPAGEGRVRAADLDELARIIDGCTRCRLSKHRRSIVIGEGDPRASVLFIGEGPGAEEDRTGRPFVGQAGRLLDGMIFALGFDRGEVYIANVVKCRPPDNRDPQVDEMAACASYLERQIELIQPRVIVALGRVAARHLTGSSKPMGALRGRWSSIGGLPLLATFHPAYLLRNPAAKREVWNDLKAVRRRLDEPDE
jgi:DNA polymerase